IERKSAQHGAIAGTQFYDTIIKKTSHPDICSIKRNSDGGTHGKSAQHGAIAGTQLCNIVALLIGDPDVCPVKGESVRVSSYGNIALKLIPAKSGKQYRVQPAAACRALGSWIPLITLRSLSSLWSLWPLRSYRSWRPLQSLQPLRTRI